MTTIFDAAALAGTTHRSFAAAGEQRVIGLRRDFAVAAADLWSAWTEPARLARWLGEVRGEPGPAATVQLVMAPSEIATVTVLWCESPRRLIVKWEWPDEPDSFVDMRIESLDETHCRLELEHLALADAIAFDYGHGWDDFLLRAELFLDGTDPTDLSWAAVQSAVAPTWRAAAATGESDARWPVITQSGEAQVLTASRVVPRTPAEVWAALTDADSISRWFGDTTGDLAPSGRFVVAFDGGRATGTVVACEPMRSFEVRWTWDHDGVETDVRIALEPVESGTRIDLEQSGVVGPALGYAAGWSAYLAAADRSLADLPRSDDLWQVEWELAKSMAQRRPD